MQFGIFAKSYLRPTLHEMFQACADDGFPVTQFNFVSAGLAPMPESVSDSVIAEIRTAAQDANVRIVSFSATFNMIHPDRSVRETGLRRLAVLAKAAQALDVPLLSLCTGSRDPENMWLHHPGNAEPDAWTDILETMSRAVEIADDYDLTLGIEPEPGNVVRTSAHARQLLDTLQTPRIGIVLDPANLIGDDLSPSVVERAIDDGLRLLGPDTVLAHGKDRFADGSVAAPGQGIVPWPRFLSGLRKAGFDGPLILHGFPIEQAPAAAQFLASVG